MTAASTSRHELDLLHARCVAATELGSSTWSSLMSSPAPTVVVGAGGSHPAAEFVARLLRDRGVVARSAYPLDATGPEQRMVAVTYSAKTPDIAEAVRRFRAGRSDGDVVVLTARPDTDLCAAADVTLSHRDPSMALERGFMSFASTVAPCAAALAASTGWREPLDACASGAATGTLVDEATSADRVAALDAAPVIDVVATGWSWPAALDLESKFAEAGLGVIRLHEAKNFSHGRYISVFDRPEPATVIHLAAGAGAGNDHDVELLAALRRHATVLTARSRSGRAVGGLELLYATQGIVVELGDAAGIDVSRPQVPVDGATLHHWDWTAAAG